MTPAPPPNLNESERYAYQVGRDAYFLKWKDNPFRHEMNRWAWSLGWNAARLSREVEELA